MKRFTNFLAATGLVAGLMSSAAYAQMTDHDQMLDSVTTALNSMQVDTSALPMLTDDQLSQLTLILDSKDTQEVKIQNANNLIDMAVMPTTLDMNSEEGIRLKTELKTNLDRVGLAYDVDALNVDQVNHLMVAFNRHKKDDDMAKQAAEAIYAGFASPAATTAAASNEGLTQQQDDINVKLSALGITPPATLTQEQVATLTGIFENGEPDADKKAAAMVALGM